MKLKGEMNTQTEQHKAFVQVGEIWRCFIPINKVGMNGVVTMEYPNDMPRDLPYLPVQIEGLLCWVGKGLNTARACCGVLCCVFLWCFVIYCCGPDECQSFSTYVPPITTLHSSNFTDLYQLRQHVSSGTVMISLFSMFFTSPLPFYQPPYYSPRHEEMEKDRRERG